MHSLLVDWFGSVAIARCGSVNLKPQVDRLKPDKFTGSQSLDFQAPQALQALQAQHSSHQ